MRLIFHIDVNSAFLSWEASRRVQTGQPDLRLIPSCIGGEPDRRTSVVLAKSIPAKRYGIRTGEPVSMAVSKCPGLVVAPPDFRLYDKCSRAFIAICRQYSPLVEQFSIDECFIDMSGTELLYPDILATAHEIKDRIRDELGFTVNIGVGNSKLCAKIASDFEKPDRVHTLYDSEIEEKLWPLPVGEMLYVGRSTVEKLEHATIRTVGELAQIPLDTLRKMVGDKFGEQLYQHARGIDDSPVTPEPPKAKGFSVETSFDDDIRTYTDAHRVLLSIADSVAFRMRRDGARASCVAVTIRTTTFKNHSHQRRLPLPTDITSEIYEAAVRLFDELWDGRSPLRLMGVSLTDITRGEVRQMTLFDAEKDDNDRERRKDKALDELRQRFGSRVISRASVTKADDRIDRKHRAEFENQKE